MRKETMTSRERILAVMRGEEVDRFPVWLKMANSTWQYPQPEPYRSMDGVELLRAAGCDVMTGCGMACAAEHPHVSVRTDASDTLRRTVWRTPDGELVGEETFDPYTRSWHPTTFMVGTAAQLRTARWYFTDTSYTVDDTQAAAAAARQQAAERDDSFTMSGIGPAPLMYLVEHLAGPENTFFLHADEPELFAETLQLMHEDRLRQLEALLPRHPADTFWFTENTSTSLISPKIFRQCCMPHLEIYGKLALACETIPVHHMCGTLNALLEDIDTLPAMANEAYTTRPLGDVSLAEGRRRMPSKTLIGGTNATLWLESPETIVRTVAADLAACPDRRRLFLTSAGVLPAPVSFAKARQVVAALKAL